MYLYIHIHTCVYTYIICTSYSDNTVTGSSTCFELAVLSLLQASNWRPGLLCYEVVAGSRQSAAGVADPAACR